MINIGAIDWKGLKRALLGDNLPNLARILNITLWLTAAFFLAWINWLEPIGGDGWFHSMTGRKSVLSFYQRSYFNANPRIGELLTNLSYHSVWNDIVISTLSVLGYQLLLFFIAFSRLPRLNSLFDLFRTLILFAACWITLPIIGLMYFFNPFTTNYLTGLAILLLFIVPYFKSNNIPDNQSSGVISSIIFFFGGIIAGMTNEHTVPAALAVIGLLLLVNERKSNTATWQVTGFLGLLSGFLLLFFAPGQSKRYSGEGSRIFDNLTDKISDIPKLLDRLWNSSSSISITLSALLILSLALIFIHRYTDDEKHDNLKQTLFTAAILIGVAHIMTLTLIISPRQGLKLLFAPVTIMLLSTLLLANYWFRRYPVLLLVLAIPAMVVNIQYGISVHKEYDFYRKEFDARVDSINMQIQKGIKDIYIVPYETKRSRLIWGDDAWRIKNGMPAMEKFFDVDSISYIKHQPQ